MSHDVAEATTLSRQIDHLSAGELAEYLMACIMFSREMSKCSNFEKKKSYDCQRYKRYKGLYCLNDNCAHLLQVEI